jgi:hypothetical protein
MSIAGISQSLSSLQGAVQLLSSKVAKEPTALAQPGLTSPADLWSLDTSANTLSSRAFAAIQELTQNAGDPIDDAVADAIASKLPKGGSYGEVGIEEFVALNGGPQSMEDARRDYVKSILDGNRNGIAQLNSMGRTDEAEMLAAQSESLLKALANGTFRFEKLDERVAFDVDYIAMHDAQGRTIGIGVSGGVTKHADLVNAYGDGKTLDDKFATIGWGNTLSPWIAIWDK